MEVGIFVAPQVGATYDDQLAAALQAEHHGFDAFVRSDHYMAAPGQTALPGPTDAWLSLAGLARDTSRIRLGTRAAPAGHSFDFDGTWYRLTACPALPKPVQAPHPPMVIGGRGLRRTPSIAARFADELNVSPAASPEQAREMFVCATTACEAIDRDPATLRRSVMVTTICGENSHDVDRRLAGPGAGQPDICGTPDEVVAQLRAFEQAGASKAYLRLVDLHDLEHIALIGDRVLPFVR